MSDFPSGTTDSPAAASTPVASSRDVAPAMESGTASTGVDAADTTASAGRISAETPSLTAEATLEPPRVPGPRPEASNTAPTLAEATIPPAPLPSPTSSATEGSVSNRSDTFSPDRPGDVGFVSIATSQQDVARPVAEATYIPPPVRDLGAQDADQGRSVGGRENDTPSGASTNDAALHTDAHAHRSSGGNASAADPTVLTGDVARTSEAGTSAGSERSAEDSAATAGGATATELTPEVVSETLTNPSVTPIETGSSAYREHSDKSDVGSVIGAYQPSGEKPESRYVSPQTPGADAPGADQATVAEDSSGTGGYGNVAEPEVAPTVDEAEEPANVTDVTEIHIADTVVPSKVRDTTRNQEWSQTTPPEAERWPASGPMRPDQEAGALEAVNALTKRVSTDEGIKPKDVPLIIEALRNDTEGGAAAADILKRGTLSDSRGLWECVSQLQDEAHAGSALMALQYGEELKAKGYTVAFEQKEGRVYDVDVAIVGQEGDILSSAQLKDMRGPITAPESPAYPGYITEKIPNRLNKAIKQIWQAPGAERQVVLNIHEPHNSLSQAVLDNVQQRATTKGIQIQIRFSDGMNLKVNPAEE